MPNNASDAQVRSRGVVHYVPATQSLTQIKHFAVWPR